MDIVKNNFLFKNSINLYQIIINGINQVKNNKKIFYLFFYYINI